MNAPLALVIEDDVDLSLIFSEALQAAQFEVEIISDGGQASTRLKDVLPVVVVLDLHLPNLSGEALLTQIRADARLAAARVIIATADPVMGEALAGSADLVLIKPISFTQLRDLALRLKTQTVSRDTA